MLSTILDKYNKWRTRCRSCEMGSIYKSLIDSHGTIKKVSKLKTVIEYKCDECETMWVLADNAQFINKVYRNELYEKWKSRSWLPTTSQMQVLNQIIGVYNYYKTIAYFPCKIELSNGRRVEKAMLAATTGDCFAEFPIDQNVTILDNSHGLSLSDYALPANVRAATMVAKERSMGYAPVGVKDTSGNRYTLISETHFFEKDGILGADISLDDSPPSKKNIVYPDWAEMYLICDLFDCKTAAHKANRT